MGSLHAHQHQKKRNKAFLHKYIAVAFSVKGNDVLVLLATDRLCGLKCDIHMASPRCLICS